MTRLLQSIAKISKLNIKHLLREMNHSRSIASSKNCTTKDEIDGKANGNRHIRTHTYTRSIQFSIFHPLPLVRLSMALLVIHTYQDTTRINRKKSAGKAKKKQKSWWNMHTTNNNSALNAQHTHAHTHRRQPGSSVKFCECLCAPILHSAQRLTRSTRATLTSQYWHFIPNRYVHFSLFLLLLCVPFYSLLFDRLGVGERAHGAFWMCLLRVCVCLGSCACSNLILNSNFLTKLWFEYIISFASSSQHRIRRDHPPMGNCYVKDELMKCERGSQKSKRERESDWEVDFNYFCTSNIE